MFELQPMSGWTKVGTNAVLRAAGSTGAASERLELHCLPHAPNQHRGCHVIGSHAVETSQTGPIDSGA